jgi:hypothetical protein
MNNKALKTGMDLRYRNGEKPRQVVFLVGPDMHGNSIVSLSENNINTHQQDGRFLAEGDHGLDLIEHDARSELKPGQVIAVTDHLHKPWRYAEFARAENNGVMCFFDGQSTQFWSLWRTLNAEEIGNDE